DGKISDSFFSNASSRSLASSVLSLFLAARAPSAQLVALSPDGSPVISPSRRSRRALDSPEGRTVVLAALAAARVRPVTSLREERANAFARDPFPAEVVGGAAQQRPGASRSSSPAMPTSVNRA